jgi:hypothetical protein
VAYTAQEEEQSLLLVEIYSVKGSVGGKYGGALIPSCVAEVGSGCGHWTEVAGAHVLDPVSVGITDAAPTGKAVVGGHKETIAGKSCGGQELMHLVEQKVYAALRSSVVGAGHRGLQSHDGVRGSICQHRRKDDRDSEIR